MFFFQPFYPSDVIRGQSSVYFVCVRVGVRVRVSSVHGEERNDVGHPFIGLVLGTIPRKIRQGLFVCLGTSTAFDPTRTIGVCYVGKDGPLASNSNFWGIWYDISISSVVTHSTCKGNVHGTTLRHITEENSE